MIALLLASWFLLSPDVRQIDPTLAAFSLQESGSGVVLPEAAEAGTDSRSWAWELSGWVNYLACGGLATSQLYRNDRSGAWDPSPENVQLRVGTIVAGVQGANMVSDALYESRRELAWITRLASIGVCGSGAGINFQRGWERR